LPAEREEREMSDAFSNYLMLLDDIEQIPLTARESPGLPTGERAVVIARVVQLVRDRVLPQSDREEAGLEALLGDGLIGLTRERGTSGAADHDAILAPVDELTRADPRDGARVQELLYRLHGAIARHFGEAEVILASAGSEKRPPSPGASGRYVSARSQRAHTGPSTWFG
jgi:hypothetical protein